MGVVQNVIGLVRGINDRRENAHIEDVMRNHMSDPQAIYKGIYQIDPMKADAWQRQYQTDQQAKVDAENAAIKNRQDRFGLAMKTIRGLPPGSDYGAAVDKMTPLLTQSLGLTPEDVAGLREAVTTNPDFVNTFDDAAWKALVGDRYKTTVAPAGSAVYRGGAKVADVPYGMKTVTTKGGDGAARTDVFDPNTGQFVTDQATPQDMSTPAPAAPVDLTTDALLPHFRAQESGGDYTAVNKDSGAMGAYQIMPDTGKALARRVGVAWRPDLMTSGSPEAVKYQDALGRAQVSEAVANGGGDPSTTAAYYFGGSDRSKWGPKTRKYAAEMTDRINGDIGGANLRSISMPGKPPVTSRTMSPAEVKAAGYPEGTVVQVDTNGKQQVKYKVPASQTKASTKDIARAQNLFDTMDQLQGMANTLLYSPGLDAATGSVQGRVPGLFLGQDAQNFIDALDNLKSNIGLNKLMEFKSQSSQGASGFGNLSNAEGQRLEAAYGVLQRTSDPSVMRRTLRDILDITAKVRARTQKQLEGGMTGTTTDTTPEIPEVGSVRKGYRFMGGDPADQSNWEKVQ